MLLLNGNGTGLYVYYLLGATLVHFLCTKFPAVMLLLNGNGTYFK